MNVRLIPISIIATFMTFTSASADFFSDVGNAVTAPIRAPIQATQDLLQGKPADEIVQNGLNLQVGAPAVAVGSTLNLIQQGNDFINRVPRDIIQTNLGDDWLTAYDTLTASQRIQQEMAFTQGRFLSQCLATGACSVNQMTAMPLAASLRDAYKVYFPHSQPLSPELVQILSRVVPFPILASARWTIGGIPNFTIPGFLNAGNEMMGQGFAVTIGNIMIFSQPPDLGTQLGVTWLLHEMFHIEQYMRYSNDQLEAVDGFAVDYITNYDGMESEAQSNAEARYANLYRQWPQ
jgi:hypothetical protein